MTGDTSVLDAPANPLVHKDLIDEQLWDRLVNRIVEYESIERPLAERVMDQALAFLKLCAQNPGGRFAPSAAVDVGWHIFILYTREYADFCARMGRFLHHEPADITGVDYSDLDVAKTVTALREHGMTVDEFLWSNGAKKTDSYQVCGSK